MKLLLKTFLSVSFDEKTAVSGRHLHEISFSLYLFHKTTSIGSCRVLFSYSRLPNVTTKRKEPHACTIGWNIDSNKPHASPGLYSSNAFIVIKASPISSSKSHIVLNKPHASLFGHYIEMNKPSLRNKAIGCYISQSRVLVFDSKTEREKSDLFERP